MRREWAGPPVCSVCVCTGRVRSPLCWVAWSPAVRRGRAGPPVCAVCVYRQGEKSPVLGSMLESCCEEVVGWATSMFSVCVQAG